MANLWVREPRPTNVLGSTLKGLGKKYTVFHYLLPAPHVLIGPEGVFTISTVWQDGAFTVKGKKWRQPGGPSRMLLGFMRQDNLGDPYSVAKIHAQDIQKLVDRVAPDSEIKVQPLLVFISPKAELEIEDPLMPVLYADPHKDPNLRDYIRNHGKSPTLTLEQLDKIDALYGLVTREDLAEAGVVEEEPAADVDVPDIDDSVLEETRTVYIMQANNLYLFDSTTDNVDNERLNLQNEMGVPVEVVHSFESDKAERLVTALKRKYARKRQKGDWYGLSKKDIAWVQTLGQGQTAETE
jgi:hypothetical protein